MGIKRNSKSRNGNHKKRKPRDRPRKRWIDVVEEALKSLAPERWFKIKTGEKL